MPQVAQPSLGQLLLGVIKVRVDIMSLLLLLQKVLFIQRVL